MCRGEARQQQKKGLSRIFQCFTPGADDRLRAVEPERKGACLLVLGAGSSNFNGVYLADPRRGGRGKKAEEASVYCKVDGPETLVYFSGWWLFNKDGSGSSYYGASADAGMPPPADGWCIKHGQSPAPRAETFASLEDVPQQLREVNDHESCALEVLGAGSPEFDGVYRICGVHQDKFCYRKDDGAQTMLYHQGWWLMNERGCGDSAYGLRCEESEVMPPCDALWRFKNGNMPAPVVRKLGAAGRIPGPPPTERPFWEESLAATSAGTETPLTTLGPATLGLASCTVSPVPTLKTTVDRADFSTDVSSKSAVSSSMVTPCSEASLSPSGCEDAAQPAMQPWSRESDSSGEAGASSSLGATEEAVLEHGQGASYVPERAVEDPDSELVVEPYFGRQSCHDMPDAAVQVSHGALREIVDEVEAAAPGEVSVAPDATAFGPDDSRALLPTRGLVSQRVSAFAQLSLNSSMGNQPVGPCADSMPDRGIVSQRIQQHQHFISSASRHPKKIA